MGTFNINGATKANYFDAIVVGSGITGGLAAKELCARGLKTLVLERGRNVEHVKDYPTAMMEPWEFEFRLKSTSGEVSDQPDCGHFFASKKEYPYTEDKPFNWYRGYQVGGRSLTWGRQCLRMSDLDFEANLKDGVATDWPVRYAEIAPWYDYVERYIGVSGSRESNRVIPDGTFLPPMEMNCAELVFRDQMKDHFPERTVTIGRVANLSKGWDGRGPCMFRNRCNRGCPFGGYFSSNAVTLPAAALTGNMTLLSDTIVSKVIFDSKTRKASGVEVIHIKTGEAVSYFAKLIFLNASAIATAAILLNSSTSEFPDGLGNSSNQLGHNLMDHFTGTGAEAELDGGQDKYYSGRRPCGIYVPRFRNIGQNERNGFIRGYGLQGNGRRTSFEENSNILSGFGIGFKDKVLKPGPWKLWLGAWGETLPYYSNTVTLNSEKKDKWGMPLTKISMEYHQNERSMQADIQVTIAEMLDKSGFRNINGYAGFQTPGSSVHEMGTARMGRDPRTSVLNKYNQMHDVKNIFITDGSFMTSSGTANPSLTYMAFTVRAVDYAVQQMKKGNL
jgi:choline dehydrogenase-like flavoprotein